MGDRKRAHQLRRIKKVEDDNKLRFLWEFMLEENLSQRDIADILKCSRQNIAATMNNEDMKLSTLRQIAEATDREFFYYFGPKKTNLNLSIPETPNNNSKNIDEIIKTLEVELANLKQILSKDNQAEL